MKNLILTASVLTALLVAGCSKNATVSPDQPTLANARAGTSAEAVTLAAPLPAAVLPAGVKTYLDQKYAGYVLVKVDRKRRPGSSAFTGTSVKFLQNGTVYELDFDASNVPVARPAGPTPPAATTARHSISYVARNELPAAVASVVTSSNYSAYAYGWTEQHTHDGVTQYDVKLFSNNQPTTLHLSASGTAVTPMAPALGGPASGTLAPPMSGTATPPRPAGPVSGTATAPKPPVPPASGTATAPKPPVPAGPASATATPPLPASRTFILDGSKMPSVINTYLQTNFSRYMFLAAEVSTPPGGTASEYTLDIVEGKQLYKLRFTATGELLMAEARH